MNGYTCIGCGKPADVWAPHPTDPFHILCLPCNEARKRELELELESGTIKRSFLGQKPYWWEKLELADEPSPGLKGLQVRFNPGYKASYGLDSSVVGECDRQ